MQSYSRRSLSNWKGGNTSTRAVGSGLQELLELIYASNAVDHIMIRKAISHAVRAHLIVDTTVNALLYSQALEVPYHI